MIERRQEMDAFESPCAMIKEGLKRKITQKHLENGTTLPKIEEKKRQPAPPVCAVTTTKLLIIVGENRKTAFFFLQ